MHVEVVGFLNQKITAGKS